MLSPEPRGYRLFSPNLCSPNDYLFFKKPLKSVGWFNVQWLFFGSLSPANNICCSTALIMYCCCSGDRFRSATIILWAIWDP